MIIGERLRSLREQKNLSQGDIEERTGLLRCYVSRVENGHTVPVVETIEKFARALGVPIYQLFYDGELPQSPPLLSRVERQWGSSGKEAETLTQFRRSLAGMKEGDRKLLLHMAQRMARDKKLKRPEGKRRPA